MPGGEWGIPFVSAITVVGTGYVGLAYAAALAELQHDVIGLDVVPSRISSLQRGVTPFFEPGLDEMLVRGTASGRLVFTTDYTKAVSRSEFVLLCVGTPSGPNGDADMTQVDAAVSSIGAHLSEQHRTIVVNKSTMPIGAGDHVEEILRRHAPTRARFGVVSNPEFLREGTALDDIFNPDRIVLGAEDALDAEAVAQLYQALDAPVLITSRRSAEMVKYAANAFLATKISFINEVAQICDELGADVSVVARGIGMDGRIGSRFLHAGLGFGGSCFPKDVMALSHMAERAGINAQLLRSVQQINRDVRTRFIDRAELALGGLNKRRIGVWGLSFKEDTDDIRSSPALDTIGMLWGRGAQVVAYDPQAMPAAARAFPELEMVHNAYQAADGADAVVLATPWAEFAEINLSRVARSMAGDLLLDGRNLFDPKMVASAGLRYLGVGRGGSLGAPAARATVVVEAERAEVVA